MLVATRDPMHHSGAPDPSSHRHERIQLADTPPATVRVMSLLQLAGSFLAIPVALGSAYSVYQANFSPDIQCQQLRANIIGMIDKKIDAATRRMLVRRDVEAFEKSCGAFDPDAKAAFVMLLQNEPRLVPVRPVASPKVEAAKPEPAKAEAPKMEAVKAEPVKTEAAKAETSAKEVVRKQEARPATKQAAAPPAAEADVAVRDDASSDARWLDAVRGALLSSGSAREIAAVPARAPAERPTLKTTLAPSDAAPAAHVPEARAPNAAAPALPPAMAVAPPPPQRAADAEDRPVPPGSIPDAPPLDIARAASGQERSSWVSKIPFVGQVLDR